MKEIPTIIKTSNLPRRQFIRHAASAAALWQVPGLFAEQLAVTPRPTEGPFYPDTLPLDTDNDLIVVNDDTTPAVGEVTYLSGRVLDRNGQPVPNAVVEIWQCDAKGVYYHSGSGDALKRRDTHFQCFGRFLTGNSGEYLFRTIKPVPYPGRTPPHPSQGQARWQGIAHHAVLHQGAPTKRPGWPLESDKNSGSAR